MIDPVRLPVVEYPETDGNPMPDGDYQGDFYRYAVDAVREHFRPRPEVYVTGDHFIYLEEGNPKNCIAPDLYVVMNGGHRMRDTYKVWEEPGGYPDFVLEIVSPSTWRTDLGAKRGPVCGARRRRILAARPACELHDPGTCRLSPRRAFLQADCRRRIIRWNIDDSQRNARTGPLPARQEPALFRPGSWEISPQQKGGRSSRGRI